MIKTILIIMIFSPVTVLGENSKITDKNGRVNGYIKEIRNSDNLRLTDKYGRTTGYIKKQNGQTIITAPNGRNTGGIKK